MPADPTSRNFAFMKTRDFIDVLSRLPSSAIAMGAPANDTDLARVEAQLGLTLPARLRELWLGVNGARFLMLMPNDNPDVQYFVAPRLLGSDDVFGAAQNLWAWPELDPEPRRLLPITDDGNGDMLVVDLHADNRDDPPVYNAFHEELGSWHERMIRPSLSLYLAALAQALGSHDFDGAWRLF